MFNRCRELKFNVHRSRMKDRHYKLCEFYKFLTILGVVFNCAFESRVVGLFYFNELSHYMGN